MTKYFAQDTPQASLERMMMSVPGFQRRGGGISLSSFHYKPEDVDCQYCLHYRCKSCQVPTCPYIAERLASGALEYRDLILECLGRNLRLRLYQRIKAVTHWDGLDQTILHKIRPYCQRAADKPKEDTPSVYWASLYLLASREPLWKTAVPALASGYIDFPCISCRGLAVRDYDPTQGIRIVHRSKEKSWRQIKVFHDVEQFSERGHRNSIGDASDVGAALSKLQAHPMLRNTLLFPQLCDAVPHKRFIAAVVVHDPLPPISAYYFNISQKDQKECAS